MAHAGTTTGLAGQPAAGSTWKSFLSLIVILAIGIGMLIAVPLLAGAKTTTVPAVDNAYTQIEAQRGATNLSAVSADTLAKAAAAKARAMSGVAPDNSLDAAVRAAAAKAALSVDSAVSVDTTYNAAEKARSGAFSGTTIDPTTFDRTPRGAHGQLP
jgi:hypothetical protein